MKVYIGGILLLVALGNAYIEFYQIQKSQAILESFLNLIPAQCSIVRDGKLTQVSAKELVYGDIVYIKAGDKVPADLVLFSCSDLKVDNSSLTGESEPQLRNVVNTQKNPLEASNIAFNGTLVINGDGYGCVLRTGDNTVIGQIAFLASSEVKRNSPMSEEIDNFVQIIGTFAGLVTLVFFLVAKFNKGLSWGTTFNFAIGTFTGFVPQGLPATVTILLSLAAKRMAKRNVLVKDLQGVETLGAITLLATDKTGTLTRNQMTVSFLWSGGRLFRMTVPKEINAPFESLPYDQNDKGMSEILYMSVLCSRARFETMDGSIATRNIFGDATEGGLLRNAASKLPDLNALYDQYSKVFEIPFNSENKWAMTIHRKPHANGVYMLYLKGAPERVLRLCSMFFKGEQAVPLTDEHRKQYDETYNLLASQGHRVLAFAGLPLNGDKYPSTHVFKMELQNFPLKDLVFYGLVSLEDPPKHGVREAIGRCREAGIKVMMVTGDHPLTAEAIGRKINLMLQDTKEKLAKRRNCPVNDVSEHDVNAIVIHGETIDNLVEEDWENIFSKEEIIFARTSPKHKLQIVKRAQAMGHIVGVTGDGVNDAPALKKADLGISMNVSGSDVSKEAAAMILIDDNFASCVNGIEEGRLIFQNLKKSIRYTLTHLMPQVNASLLYITVPLPLPLSSILILLTDLGFEMFLALTYAWDPPENEAFLMKLLPRKPVTNESTIRLKREQELGRPLKRWEKWKYPTQEEVLVDGDLLSWAYIEAGTLETIGCLFTYFFALWASCSVTPGQVHDHGELWGLEDYTTSTGQFLSKDVQVQCLASGQSAYYWALFIHQLFNLFITKARMEYPYGSFMFQNVRTFYGIVFGTIFCALVVFVPPFNLAFGTNYQMPLLVIPIALGWGVILYLYGILRCYIARKSNPMKYADQIQGLDLHPTRWSTHGRS